MGDINRVLMVARLTRDVELKHTAGGTPVVNFAVANNQSRKINGEWKDEGHFFECVLWGNYGEAMSKYLFKGTKVTIEGILQQDRWEQDGQKRSRVKINIKQICLHPKSNRNGDGGYSESGPVSGPTPPASGSAEDDEIPF